MDSSELTKLLLEWEELEKQQAIIAEVVEKEVLKLGKTFKVGNVSASYSNPRKSFDYETAVFEGINDQELRDWEIASFTEVVQKVDWRGICKKHNIDNVPFTVSGEPKVTIKLK